MIRNLMRGTALGFALALPLFSSAATAQIAVSANDNKIALVDGVNTVPANPPPDTVTVLDIGASPPKVLGEVQAPSSVVGVPQSVAATAVVLGTEEAAGRAFPRASDGGLAGAFDDRRHSGARRVGREGPAALPGIRRCVRAGCRPTGPGAA